MAEMERQEMEDALYDKTKKQRQNKLDRSNRETIRARTARQQEKKHENKIVI